MEEQTSTRATSPYAPPARPSPSDPVNRTAFWVLLSASVGFLLPICGCVMLMMTSFFSLSLLDSGAGVAASGTGDAVAIIRVEGAISSGDDVEYGAGAVSGVVIDDLNKAAEDPTVKAIVLRVDSPGGTVTGSAQIYEALKAFEKPVVVSMASVAASGGYYVSAPAQYIFARPDTVTGSIGVIYTLFNAEELLDNMGVEVVTITSGRNKALGSAWEELNEEQRAILETLIEESYIEFVRIIAEGRGMTQEEVLALADGRIYSGRQALAINLVDELGDLDDAIAKAADLGGIVGEPRIVEYEHLPSLQHLLSGFNTRLTQSQSDQILQLVHEFTTPSLEYRYAGPR